MDRRYDGEPVMVIGHQKGRSTKENVQRNFGGVRPEGYRKALRLMSLAERFARPIIIDTPGAYPRSVQRSVDRPRRLPRTSW